MKELSREEQRAVLLGMADEIDRICKEHNLTYYLTYGTLLGAVRHQGFIPWDDDFDIVMMRKDYDMFVEHFAQWCQVEYLELRAPGLGNCTSSMAKLIDTRTWVKEHFVREELSHGLWVDIFVLDNIDPAVPTPFKKIHYLNLLRYLIVSDPKEGQAGWVQWAKRILGPLARRIDPCKVTKKIDSIMKSRFPEPTGYVCEARHWPKTQITRSGMPSCFSMGVFEPVQMPFEDRSFTCPAGYDQVLSSEYKGDWRTPLPPDERLFHMDKVFWVENA